MFGELGYKLGAEIGVEQGQFSEVLCKSNPDLMLAAIDAWRAYRGYRDHTSQEKLDGFHEEARRRLEPYSCHIYREFSMDALKRFPDGSLDFVYIDANHELPFVMFDIIEWSKKVRVGGIVAGHDYYQSTRLDSKMHVVYAVNAYVQAYRIRPWFVLGEKNAPAGSIRDKERSWLWVRY